MSKIQLTVEDTIINGKQISFQAPCSSDDTTGLIINDTEYDIVDASGDSMLSTVGVWASDAMVSVILNTTTNKAYIQNPCIDYKLPGVMYLSVDTTNSVSGLVVPIEKDPYTWTTSFSEHLIIDKESTSAPNYLKIEEDIFGDPHIMIKKNSILRISGLLAFAFVHDTASTPDDNLYSLTIGVYGNNSDERDFDTPSYTEGVSTQDDDTMSAIFGENKWVDMVSFDIPEISYSCNDAPTRLILKIGSTTTSSIYLVTTSKMNIQVQAL